MKSFLYNEICHFRKHFGNHNMIYWHNDLENSCQSHVQYMGYHQVVQHAPQAFLDGAFECVAGSTYYYNMDNNQAIIHLLYDSIAHSEKHMNLVMNAKYIAAAYKRVDTEHLNKHFLCIRGY